MEQERLFKVLGGESRIVGERMPVANRVVKSAGRVLQILELFDILKRDALVSEVAYLLEMPQSSTSVLLRSMTVLGYLHYDGEKRRYGPTPMVAFLGSWVNGSLMSDGHLTRLMHRLNARTSQAVVIAIRNQVWAQYVHVVQATGTNRFLVVKGSQLPLTRSAAGLALLAELLDKDIRRIALRINAEAKDKDSLTNITTLMSQIAEIRNCGYASTCDTVTQDGGMIAMGLPTRKHLDHLVIGVAGPSSLQRDRKEELVAIMREEIDLHVERRVRVRGQIAPALPTKRTAYPLEDGREHLRVSPL